MSDVYAPRIVRFPDTGSVHYQINRDVFFALLPGDPVGVARLHVNVSSGDLSGHGSAFVAKAFSREELLTLAAAAAAAAGPAPEEENPAAA